MRKNIILKSTLRQFWRSLFLALLVGIATFFFVSRVMEYDIVVNEMERISRHYRSIGYFISTRGEMDVSEAADFIRELESPHIAFADFNQSGFATLHNVHNTLTGVNRHSETRVNRLRIHDREVFFYGELVDVFGEFVPFAPRTILTFRVDTVVAGYPEWVVPGRKIDVIWRVEDGASLELRNELFEIGKRYFIRADWQRIPVGMIRANILSPLYSSEEEQLWALSVRKGEEIDLTAPNLAHLPNMIELLNLNHRSMRVWTSMDLTAKPQTQSGVDMWYLHRGRWINHNDYLQENRVAMVHQTFARGRNINLGDSITLTLWDLHVRPIPGLGAEHYSWGLRDSDQYWQSAMTEKITLEIVGIFTYRDATPMGPDAKDIWVPTSVVPEWFGIEAYPTNLSYSFVLHSTDYQDIFYETHKDALGEFGEAGRFYQFRFMEHGADQFWETAEPIIASLWLNVMIFAVIFLLIILLIILSYHRQHRRNVAILRALGTPLRRVIRYLSSPILLFWFPMIILGSYISREFAQTAATEILVPLWEYGDYEVRATNVDLTWFLSFTVLISCSVLLIAFLTLCGVTTGRVLGRLQEEVSKTMRREKKEKQAMRQNEKQTTTGMPSDTFVKKSSSESMKMISYLVTDLTKDVKNQQKANWRNINRRILRTPLRTILLVAIALLSVIAFGWLQSSINHNKAEIERMWNTTIVGEIHKMSIDDAIYHYEMEQIISASTVASVLQTGFIDSIYLEAGFELAYLVPPLLDGSFPYDIWEEWGPTELYNPYRNRMFAVTDLVELVRDNNVPTDVFGRPRGVSTILGDLDFDPLKITYVEGFDPASFAHGVDYAFDMVIPIILPEYLMLELELEFGDHVFISHPFHERRPDHPFIEPPRLPDIPRTWLLVRPWRITGEIVGMYTGIIHRPFAHNAIVIPHGIIQPIRNHLPASRVNRVAAYSTVRFFVNPARNRETEELRELLERIVSNPRAGTVPLSFTLRDEELFYVVQQLEKNLELLHLLYPIVLGVSLVIALGLSALTVLQNMKNAAVMRILGMCKRRTRWAFLKEQTVITLGGLLLGLLVLAIIENTFFLDGRIYLFKGLYLVAMFLGSFLGAILISNQTPLDLLQVKE